MATITKGYSFGSTELVTNTKLHSFLDDATITDTDWITYDDAVVCYMGNVVYY
jgi:hypothetical protein